MRAKLTAKHPRPASPSRAPVRAGSPSGRKPPRASTAPAAPATKTAAPRARAKPGGAASAAPRRDGATAKPRDARGSSEGRGARDTRDTRNTRGGSDARGARGARDDSGREDARRSPRTSGYKGAAPERRADDAPRRAPRTPDERGPRAPRENSERAPRARAGDRPGGFGRAAGRPGDDEARRAPRGDRGDRPTRGATERPARGPAARTAGNDDTRKFARPVKADAASPGGRAPSAPRREGSPSRFGAGAKPGNREGRAPSDARARPFAGKRADTADRKTAAPRVDKPVKTAPARVAASEHSDTADGTVRLSKRMSELGLCSRREADEWIENGWVRVDGERIDTLGSRVRPDQHIEVTRDAQAAQSRQVTILLHKPVGYVSGQAEDGYEPAITLITAANHWDGDRATTRFAPSQLRALAPAGRLDIDSTGLLVLTQDGRIAKQLIGENSSVEKEYLVRVTYGDHSTDVAEHFPAEKLALLRFGLSLDGAALKAAKVSWQNGEQLRFVLREGKKRQIRRMCELVGLHVVGLKRVRMGSVALGALPQGKWRYLLPDEAF
ncbi:pseudouridine synthase [Trinickia dabaoshanensis]|uniref:Dual-specificity RNA pseudouridine synthase RluF n=1 Tax=Trinickia dabaoshanensis TaxID=564714 RepID=A0A2N7W2X0_9BURK|nr:pseudouridine synthase [Trinickia dabaoshanensis]PMS23746.1 pseudouridine synthase [Trinickia dabaoshanensis]